MPAIGRREVGLLEHVALGQHLALLEEHRARRGELPQLVLHPLETTGVTLVEREPLLRDLRRREDQVAQLALAVVFDRERVSRHRPRHAAGQRARLAERGVRFAVAEEHVRRGGGRRHLAAVNGDQRPIGAADEQEAAPADARVVGVHHSQRQGHRHRRIHGVAAILERRGPRHPWRPGGRRRPFHVWLLRWPCRRLLW